MSGLVLETKAVNTDTLQVFHKNPRVGNVEAIAESLAHNGQYKPIVVNKGSKTGRKDEILCGNHTYLAARRLGWELIEASIVDVDDELATTIVLADNKTADLGEYEEALLAELFQGLPSTEGTGYTQEEVDDLIAQLEGSIDLEATAKTLEDFRADMPESLGVDEQGTGRSTAEILLDNETEEQQEQASRRGAGRGNLKEDEAEHEPAYDAAAELHVMLELKEREIWKGNNEWGIPELRSDMLVEELPQPLKTWGGNEATPDDGETWFLYNYSLGGRKGLPEDRTILSFFTYDYKFEQWWTLPAYYTAKHLAAGIKCAVVPDFSFYLTDPRAQHMWSAYRGQWMGRFFQEAGMRVIPRLQFAYTDPKTLDIAMLGIPKNPPILATSHQNIDADGEKDMRTMAAILDEACQHLQPKNLLVYGGPPGQRMAKMMKWNDGNIVLLDNYAAVRRNVVFDKKDAGAKMTAKQRKELKEKLAEQMGYAAPTERERALAEEDA